MNFIKNNYYDGKHLSADSFITEQKYNSDKIAELAKIIFGKGVIYGFEVIAQQYYDTIEIVSGIAVDSEGRFIVLDKNIILPITTIDGFNPYEHTKILSAVFSEVKESSDTIMELCSFTYEKTEDSIEIAKIIFENGKITNIVDLRTIVDSKLFDGFAERAAAVLEKKITDKLSVRIDNIIQNISKIYQYCDKKFEEIANKQKEFEEKLKEIAEISFAGAKYGDIILAANDKKVLTSDEIILNQSVYMVEFCVINDMSENREIFGDFIVYKQKIIFGLLERTVIIKFKKKGVIFDKKKKTFRLRFELSRACPGRVIKLRWYAVPSISAAGTAFMKANGKNNAWFD